MNWDQYKEASKHIATEFGKKIQKLDIDILTGKADKHYVESVREDIRNLLSEMFALQDQLENISQSPETMVQVLADVIGAKGSRREELLNAARAGGSVKRPDAIIHTDLT